jgi:hypothetical protein
MSQLVAVSLLHISIRERHFYGAYVARVVFVLTHWGYCNHGSVSDVHEEISGTYISKYYGSCAPVELLAAHKFRMTG